MGPNSETVALWLPVGQRLKKNRAQEEEKNKEEKEGGGTRLKGNVARRFYVINAEIANFTL